MSVLIECAQTAHQESAAERIRDEVFRREWGLKLGRPLPPDSEKRRTFLARCGLTGEYVATLTAVETTGDIELHDRVGLRLEEGERAARYTRLAVLKPYRGLHLPHDLILKARREFVVPRKIDVTWLVFDAQRARVSWLCRVLGYEASLRVFETEHGPSRLLVRREAGAAAATSNPRAHAFAGLWRLSLGLVDLRHRSPENAPLSIRQPLAMNLEGEKESRSNHA